MYKRQHQYIPENSPNFADTAQLTYDASMLYGAKQPGGAGKPVIRGETGFVVTIGGQATNQFQKDTSAIWLHNLIWGGINPGGMLESYWHENTHIYRKNNNGTYQFDHRVHYGTYYRFIQNVPLSNGQYQDAQATASDANLRVWGQKDLSHGSAHLWIQNKQHTWKNVVDGVAIPAIASTVTIAGFQSGTSYVVEWWDTYQIDPSRQVIGTETIAAAADGTLTLPVNNLTTDVAVKILSTATQESQHEVYLSEIMNPDD